MPIEEIHILHHTHVDIGYTDLQPVVFQKHLAFIEQTLDLCRRTDDYPEEARFRWVHEVSWPVALFLKEHPERSGELIARLQEGRMELCALYVNPTELFDMRSFREALRPSQELAAGHGFPLTTATTADVPGLAWGMADLLAAERIPYLSVSPNPMVSKPIRVERPFQWVGPRGGQVLVWMADHRKGWYGEGHILGFPRGYEAMRAGVTDYLQMLAGEGYPWRVLALHFAADNYPPCAELPDLVRQWNAEGNLPRMRISTHRDFFESLTRRHEGPFATYRAAWPDWWSEGVGSAAYETALSRETHARLRRIEALQQRVGDGQDLWPIFEDLLLFDEHTWGCQSMALRPYSFDARASWAHKALTIYRAASAAARLEESLAGRLSPTAVEEGPGDARDASVRGAGPAGASWVAFNPLASGFHGPATIPGVSPAVRALAVPGEASVPVQHAPASSLSEANSWSVLSVRAGETRTLRVMEVTAEGGGPTADDGILRNEHYEIRFEPSGKATAILERESGRELLDSWAPWGFAEVIHESIPGAADRQAVWERTLPEMPYGKRRTDAPFRREGALAAGQVIRTQQGPVFASVTWSASLPYAPLVETEIRLWRGAKRIDVEVRVDKQACQRYESLYVAFPFGMDAPRALLHSGGAVFEAEREQLPGTCRDFYAVEQFAAFEDRAGWVALCPVDAPLVQIGALTFGRWADHLSIARGAVYAWPLNNFWYTNFPGVQSGPLRFRYSLTSGAGPLDTNAALEFADRVRVGVSVRQTGP